MAANGSVPELQAHRENWERSRTPEMAASVLAGIGHLRLAGLPEERLRDLRKIEIAARRDFEAMLEAWGSRRKSSRLEADAARLLADRRNRELAAEWRREREKWEFAWQTAKEYADEELPKNWRIVGEVRDFLDRADDILLLEPEIVDLARACIEGKPDDACDPDFFWWRPLREGGCYLPGRRRDEYMAWHSEGRMGDRTGLFLRHLLSCPDCREQERSLAQMSLLASLGHRPALASASTAADSPPRCYSWADRGGTCEASLCLQDSPENSDEQELCFALLSQRGDFAEARLLFGDLRLDVSPEGCAWCRRGALEERIEQGEADCRLVFPDGEILLEYRGERHD